MKFSSDLDQEANANATLICRDTEYVVLGNNFGTYVIERRLKEKNRNELDWSDATYVSTNLYKIFFFFFLDSLDAVINSYTRCVCVLYSLRISSFFFSMRRQISGTEARLSGLIQNASYEFRYHRVFINGISKPEIVGPFKTMLSTLPNFYCTKLQLKKDTLLIINEFCFSAQVQTSRKKWRTFLLTASRLRLKIRIDFGRK